MLTESLIDGDTVLRFRVLTALNKLRAAGSSRPLDTKLVETVLAAEVVGHLRWYQILGTLDYAVNSSEPVAQGLRESMTQEVERIFRLVKLLSPVYDLESAYVGLQSSKRDIHDNALEFLENILKPQLRTMLLPLLDATSPCSSASSSRTGPSARPSPPARRRRRSSPKAEIPGFRRAPHTP